MFLNQHLQKATPEPEGVMLRVGFAITSIDEPQRLPLLDIGSDLESPLIPLLSINSDEISPYALDAFSLTTEYPPVLFDALNVGTQDIEVVLISFEWSLDTTDIVLNNAFSINLSTL